MLQQKINCCSVVCNWQNDKKQCLVREPHIKENSLSMTPRERVNKLGQTRLKEKKNKTTSSLFLNDGPSYRFLLVFNGFSGILESRVPLKPVLSDCMQSY